MHCLTSLQTHQVAGAITVTFDCLSIPAWQELHADAQKEGIMLGTVAGMVTGAAFYGVVTRFITANAAVGVGIASPAASLAFMYGYFKGYNNYELWPWNS